MKIVGLITEYNPFHNGHLYHIQKTKEITGADAVVVVMSGNYVQRGAPAIMPKHLRAAVALEAGVPVVIELAPFLYSKNLAVSIPSASEANAESTKFWKKLLMLWLMNRRNIVFFFRKDSGKACLFLLQDSRL